MARGKFNLRIAVVRNAWTILYVAAVFRYQQVTMQQKMKAMDAAGRAKVCIGRL